jgi:hypothetical protein
VGGGRNSAIGFTNTAGGTYTITTHTATSYDASAVGDHNTALGNFSSAIGTSNTAGKSY